MDLTMTHRHLGMNNLYATVQDVMVPVPSFIRWMRNSMIQKSQKKSTTLFLLWQTTVIFKETLSAALNVTVTVISLTHGLIDS